MSGLGIIAVIGLLLTVAWLLCVLHNARQAVRIAEASREFWRERDFGNRKASMGRLVDFLQ